MSSTDFRSKSVFDNMANQLGGDIMHEYKNNRFVVTAAGLIDSEPGYSTVVLSDIGFWNDHYCELEQWCQEHDCIIRGMTVDIPNDRTRTMWMLRWS